MRVATTLSVLFLVAALPAKAANFATQVTDATFKLFNPDSTSACFVLRGDGPDAGCYVVTTAHTLERTSGDTAILVLRKPADEGGYERHDHTIDIRQNGKPLWVKHADHDVAAIQLPGPLPVEVAALPLKVLADNAGLERAGVHICGQLFVLTYPERFEANGAGFPVARQGIFASPPLLPAHNHPTFLADFTTFNGDSGGPVFVATEGNQTPLVVGMVMGKIHHDERIESEYERRQIRHLLGIGIVLHARYVRQTIELAANANPAHFNGKPTLLDAGTD